MNHSEAGPRCEPAELRHYRALGLQLIPLHRHWKKDKQGKPIGKAPVHAAWTTRDYSSFDAARHMLEGGNVGVRLPKTVVAIDADPRHYRATDKYDDDLNPIMDNPLARFADHVGLDLCSCAMVQTGADGFHVLLEMPGETNVVGKLSDYPGLEFKTAGTQLVAAGSIHPDTKKNYRWVNECPMARAPWGMLELIRRNRARAGAQSPDKGGDVLTEEEFGRVLDALDPEDYAEANAFRDVLYASHHATGGAAWARAMLIEWARQDPDYDNAAAIDENGGMWDRARLTGDRLITAATLFQKVAAAGRADILPARHRRAATKPAVPGASAVPVGDRPEFEVRNGRVCNTLANTMLAIRSADLGLAFDELAQRPLLRAVTLPWQTDVGRELNDDTVRVIRHWIIECYGWEPSKENVTEAAHTLAFEAMFSPVRDYLDTPEWDGVERIDRLMPGYLGSPDGEYERQVGRKFMIAAVRRARRPGCKFDLVPILEGKQGTGKSSAVRILAGEWHSDAPLGSLENKDAGIALQNIWIMELGELATLARAEVDHLKAFVSRVADRFRPPYEKTSKTFPRRCVFMGTTNASGYLRDLTGNRRFLPIETGHIDLDALSRHRDQLWAEAATAEAAGETIELPRELWVEAAGRQSQRTVEDPWISKLREYVERQDAPQRLSSTQLLEEALGLHCSRQNQADAKRLRQAMTVLEWRYKPALRIGARTTTGYEAPAAMQDLL
ncbi:MAG: VapE domain-containing protein [Hyphomicrobiaceae bacterium]